MKILRQNETTGERGSVLVPAILVVVAVAALSIVHMRLDLARAREQRASIDGKRAFYLAEAGLAEGFAGLVSGMSGNVGTEDAPARFANGLFWVVAREAGRGRVELESTGLCGAGRASLAIVVERQSDSSAAAGFFADQDVVVEAGAKVFSYDSRLGSPAHQDCITPAGARVGANHDVHIGGLAAATEVHGSARPGPAGLLVQSGTTTITGSMAPFAAPTALPPIDVPSYGSLGVLEAGALSGTLRTATGEASYSRIEVQENGRVQIRGPARLVVNQLLVGAGGRLEIDTSGGPVRLYVTDRLDLGPGSTFETLQDDPRSVSLLVSASDSGGEGDPEPAVRLEAAGTVRATIYAPEAQVTIPATLDLGGAVLARDLTLAENSQVHFDRSLLEAGADEGGLPSLVAWRLVELPQVPLVRLGWDALSNLTDDGTVLLQSRDAHFAIGVQPH